MGHTRCSVITYIGYFQINHMKISVSYTLTSHHLSALCSFSFALDVGGAAHDSTLGFEGPAFSILFSSKITKQLLEALPRVGAPRDCRPPEKPVNKYHEMCKCYSFLKMKEEMKKVLENRWHRCICIFSHLLLIACPILLMGAMAFIFPLCLRSANETLSDCLGSSSLSSSSSTFISTCRDTRACKALQ